MPRKNTRTYDKGNYTFTEKPEMEQVVLDNCERLSIVQLAELTDIKYASVASFLESRGLVANRYASKRKSIKPLLAMSEIQTAYLAGMIDGDGTLSLQHYKKLNYIRPLIKVTNTSYFLMKYMESLGFWTLSKTNNFGRNYFIFEQSGFELLEVYRMLEPHLVIKKLQCQHLIGLCEKRMEQAKREKPTRAMLAHIREIRKLNVQKDRFKKQKKLYEKTNSHKL